MSRGDEEVRGWSVRGRVQGVGFRWWTRREAERLGLRGWVRNRADGSVEVEAAGSADALERFAEALRRGPPGARVDELVGREASGAMVRDGFEIER